MATTTRVSSGCDRNSRLFTRGRDAEVIAISSLLLPAAAQRMHSTSRVDSSPDSPLPHEGLFQGIRKKLRGRANAGPQRPGATGPAVPKSHQIGVGCRLNAGDRKAVRGGKTMAFGQRDRLHPPGPFPSPMEAEQRSCRPCTGNFVMPWSRSPAGSDWRGSCIVFCARDRRPVADKQPLRQSLLPRWQESATPEK
ncbi:hypothetical protein FQR65_LT20835 [Abscondita terminalis]|nr:hypothetical protein FQR65_LT20835 [Abscondita terminalis]